MTHTSGVGIYAIINRENEKAYVGSTIDFRKRWNQHKSKLGKGIHKNPHLQGSWNKYGDEAFEFTILEHVKDPNALIIREQHWLDEFQLVGEVYNVGIAASNPMLGRSVSEESRRKMSKAGQGRIVSEETRGKLSKALKGKRNALGSKHSKEANLRKSKALRGKGNGMHGKSHSKKTRRQMSTSHLGKQHTEETKNKISKALRGKSRAPFSEEWRRNLSKANSRRYPSFYNQKTGEVIPAGGKSCGIVPRARARRANYV